jgi:tetratricopeptide (TPR) repeat protein
LPCKISLFFISTAAEAYFYPKKSPISNKSSLFVAFLAALWAYLPIFVCEKNLFFAMNRLEQLQRFLDESPQDAFLHYALAQEYLKINDLENTQKHYDWLLEQQPDYTATYYHAAAFFTAIGEIEKAKQVYQNGIKKCQEVADNFALRELKSAFELFEMEYL